MITKEEIILRYQVPRGDCKHDGGQISHQASPRKSNWLLARRSRMLIGLQVWRMFLSNLKEYLTYPPILVAPASRQPFLLYVWVMHHSLGALLAQNNDQNHKQAIYYLSRTMIGAEYRYKPIEKECLALVFTIQKMCHYLTGQRIQIISRVNPLRLLMKGPSSLYNKLAKWAIFLSQYEMQFMSQKAIKG